MAAPTTITITYGSGSTVTLPIPNPPSSGNNYSIFVSEIVIGGGFWFTNAGVLTFIPIGQVTQITAQ